MPEPEPAPVQQPEPIPAVEPVVETKIEPVVKTKAEPVAEPQVEAQAAPEAAAPAQASAAQALDVLAQSAPAASAQMQPSVPEQEPSAQELSSAQIQPSGLQDDLQDYEAMAQQAQQSQPSETRSAAQQQAAQEASSSILASFEKGAAPLAVVEPQPEPQPEAEPEAPQQKSFSDLGQLNNDTWWQLVEELSVAGVSKSIALSCAVVKVEANSVALVLDETQATLYNEVHLGRIKDSFESYFEAQLQLQIEVAQVTSETPAQRKVRIAAERLARAKDIIANDSFVQALTAEMGAQVVPDSIAYFQP